MKNSLFFKERRRESGTPEVVHRAVSFSLTYSLFSGRQATEVRISLPRRESEAFLCGHMEILQQQAVLFSEGACPES